MGAGVIRVALADDHALLRQGLRAMLEEHRDIRIVGEAGNADELLTVLEHSSAEVVVLDVSMPGPGIVPLLEQLGQRFPAVRTLVLSQHPEEQYAVRALSAGARGYVTKDRTLEELVAAVRRVHRGLRYITASLAERLAARLDPATTGGHAALSDREFDVLRGLGAGLPVKAIAARLGISPKTVTTYRARILEKLGLATNADLVRYTVEHGISLT